MMCTLLHNFDTVLGLYETGNQMNDQVLTVKDVAGYLKVNDRTVYRMAAAGKIPAFKVGSSWRFKQSEIEKWIQKQSNKIDEVDGSVDGGV